MDRASHFYKLHHRANDQTAQQVHEDTCRFHRTFVPEGFRQQHRLCDIVIIEGTKCEVVCEELFQGQPLVPLGLPKPHPSLSQTFPALRKKS